MAARPRPLVREPGVGTLRLPEAASVTSHGSAGGTPQAHARAGRSSIGHGRAANSQYRRRRPTDAPSLLAVHEVSKPWHPASRVRKPSQVPLGRDVRKPAKSAHDRGSVQPKSVHDLLAALATDENLRARRKTTAAAADLLAWQGSTATHPPRGRPAERSRQGEGVVDRQDPRCSVVETAAQRAGVRVAQTSATACGFRGRGRIRTFVPIPSDPRKVQESHKRATPDACNREYGYQVIRRTVISRTGCSPFVRRVLGQ